MHQAGPTFRLELGEHTQKNAHGFRESKILGRYKSPQQEKVCPQHQQADVCFKGHGQPRQLTGQLAKEEQEKRFPRPPLEIAVAVGHRAVPPGPARTDHEHSGGPAYRPAKVPPGRREIHRCDCLALPGALRPIGRITHSRDSLPS